MDGLKVFEATGSRQNLRLGAGRVGVNQTFNQQVGRFRKLPRPTYRRPGKAIGRTEMKGIARESEVIVRLDFMAGATNITVVSWPSMARRMERPYGKPTDIRGQVHRWKVKGLLVAFWKPRKVAVLAPAGPLNRGFSRLSVGVEG